MHPIESKDRATILIHFYRAMVSRADVWRVRMDTTTNWAIGATAAIVSFALGSPGLPHYVVFMAPLLTASFLMLEARRLTFYHLWQGRVLVMEQELIRPALHGGVDAAEADDGLVRALDRELGRTVPSMPISKAVARRLRRIYVYLFAAQWLAWILKLATQPNEATSLAEVVRRANTGAIPGAAVMALSIVALSFLIAVAIVRGGVNRGARSVDVGV